MIFDYEPTSANATLEHVHDFADADRLEANRRLYITTKLANEAMKNTRLGEGLDDLAA